MVTDKKNFVLRIDRDTYQHLEKWATDEFRSVNGQIEYILSQAVRVKNKAADKPSTASSKATEATSEDSLPSDR